MTKATRLTKKILESDKVVISANELKNSIARKYSNYKSLQYTYKMHTLYNFIKLIPRWNTTVHVHLSHILIYQKQVHFSNEKKPTNNMDLSKLSHLGILKPLGSHNLWTISEVLTIQIHCFSQKSMCNSNAPYLRL